MTDLELGISSGQDHNGQVPEGIIYEPTVNGNGSGPNTKLKYSEPRRLLEECLELRTSILNGRKEIAPEVLANIRKSTLEWMSNKEILQSDGRPSDSMTITERTSGLVGFLNKYHREHVTPGELEASELYVRQAVGMHESTPSAGDADASYVFGVHIRSIIDPDYAAEIEPCIPAIRFVDPAYAALMLRGLPACVIDAYRPVDTPDEYGSQRRGYLVYTPIPDIAADYVQHPARTFREARQNVNDMVDFAQRIGATLVGLGGIIPKLTRYGQLINNKGVDTTTGHGGTIQIAMDTKERAVAEGFVKNGQPMEELKVGVLGLGSIGESIAIISAVNYPNSIVIYDTNEDLVTKTKTELRDILDGSDFDSRISVAKNGAELIRNSDIIISAITTKIGLTDIGIKKGDLAGKFFIDDSQPGAIDAHEVYKLGGRLAWVIGRSVRGRGTPVIARRGYDYGSMADAEYDLFGCEAEVALLSQLRHEISSRRDITGNRLDHASIRRAVAAFAIREAVTPESARLISQLFTNKVEAAPLQAFGRRLDD